MEELLNLKREIENLQNDIKTLVHDRDAKKTEAEQITDKNSNFYKISINESNDIQNEINAIGEKKENLRKEFDQKLEIEKEKKLKELEKKKAGLDKIALLKKEDKVKKIEELKKNQKALSEDIKKRENSIKELRERINMQHITNPKDVLIQNLEGSKRFYEEKKKEFKRSQDDLKYLSIQDPRAEFMKVEQQIAKINKLEYNNLEEFINENRENSSIDDDKNLKNQDMNIQSVDTELKIDLEKDNKHNENVPVNTIEESNKVISTSEIQEDNDKSNNTVQEINDNAAENDTDIQNKSAELDKFNERQNKIRKSVKEIKQNIDKNDEDKNNEKKESYLTKSLTDIQIEKHKSYTEAFERLEQETDKFYYDHEEELQNSSKEQLYKIMSEMSSDASMLLASKIKREANKDNEYEEVEESKSFFDKIKSVFNRKNKGTKALATQSKFRKIFNKIKDKLSKIQEQNEYEENSAENETNEEKNTKEKLRDRLYKEYGQTSSHQEKEYKTAEQVRKEMNIDISIDK